MEELKRVVAVLLAVGIIFGTFANLAAGTALGFDWFVNLLWFAIGFPVLLGIGNLIYDLLVAGEEKLKAATK